MAMYELYVIEWTHAKRTCHRVTAYPTSRTASIQVCGRTSTWRKWGLPETLHSDNTTIKQNDNTTSQIEFVWEPWISFKISNVLKDLKDKVTWKVSGTKLKKRKRCHPEVLQSSKTNQKRLNLPPKNAWPVFSCRTSCSYLHLLGGCNVSNAEILVSIISLKNLGF